MNFRKEILILVICSIVLAPILFFPLSNDLSIFFHTAKSILNGGKLYVDYIDIKPPFGYIIFIPIVLFSGHSEFMLRLVDFFIQLFIVIFLYRMIYKNSSNEIIAFIACLFYSFSYVSFNFNQTMQLESFMGLLILLLIGIQTSETNKNHIWLIRGVLLGLLISIKFTSGVVYLAIILDDVLSGKNSKTYIKQGLTFLSFIITLFLANIILIDSETMVGFSKAFEYLMIYGSQPSFDFEFLKFSLKKISIFLADNLSLSLLIFFLLGIVYILKNESKHLYNFSVIIFIFLFISIVLERKFFEYHFLRIYIPLSILAAYGFTELYREIIEKKTKFNLQAKFITVLTCLFLLLFSPFPRWFQALIPSYYYLSSKEKYDKFYERPWTSSVLRKSSLETASFINKNIKPEDKVLVISNINNQLNFFIEKGKKSRFALSCFYLNSYNLDYYEKLFSDEMKNADWLIIQTNDGNLYAMGHLLSSYDALIQNKVLGQLFLENFYQVKDFVLLKVFARK